MTAQCCVEVLGWYFLEVLWCMYLGRTIDLSPARAAQEPIDRCIINRLCSYLLMAHE